MINKKEPIDKTGTSTLHFIIEAVAVVLCSPTVWLVTFPFGHLILTYYDYHIGENWGFAMAFGFGWLASPLFGLFIGLPISRIARKHIRYLGLLTQIGWFFFVSSILLALSVAFKLILVTMTFNFNSILIMGIIFAISITISLSGRLLNASLHQAFTKFEKTPIAGAVKIGYLSGLPLIHYFMIYPVADKAHMASLLLFVSVSITLLCIIPHSKLRSIVNIFAESMMMNAIGGALGVNTIISLLLFYSVV